MENEKALVANAPTGMAQTIESAEAFTLRLEQFTKLANGVIQAGLAPKGMSRPEQVIIAMQTGHELGLPPMQSLKSVTVINGRSGLMGEAALGLLNAVSALKPGTQFEKHYEGEGDDLVCTVQLWRAGREEPSEHSFGVADARKAKLWGKSGPWTDYPKQMLKWRALGFLLRDHFADVTMGLALAEELRDIPSSVRGTDFSAPADPGEDPLLQQALGHAEDAEIVEDRVDNSEVVTPADEEDVPGVEPAQVNEQDPSWVPPAGAVEEVVAAACEPYCDLEDGHPGKCESIPRDPYEAPPVTPSGETDAGPEKVLMCKCGSRTLVKKGTPSPVACAATDCGRRFRKVQRGQRKGDVVNEKDPSWVQPGEAPEGEQGALL